MLQRLVIFLLTVTLASGELIPAYTGSSDSQATAAVTGVDGRVDDAPETDRGSDEDRGGESPSQGSMGAPAAVVERATRATQASLMAKITARALDRRTFVPADSRSGHDSIGRVSCDGLERARSLAVVATPVRSHAPPHTS